MPNAKTHWLLQGGHALHGICSQDSRRHDLPADSLQGEALDLAAALQAVFTNKNTPMLTRMPDVCVQKDMINPNKGIENLQVQVRQFVRMCLSFLFFFIVAYCSILLPFLANQSEH